MLGSSILVVVATRSEAEALGVPAAVCGVGPVAAALGTFQAVTPETSLIVSAGIGGAYPSSGLGAGDLAVSDRMIHADLGAWDGPRWLTVDELGLSVEGEASHGVSFPAWSGAERVARSVRAALGPVLTVSAVTGDARRADALERWFPGALAEGMEGAGVAHAAYRLGLPCLEVRGISNAVGPRDRGAWRLQEAMEAARRGVRAVEAVFGAQT